MGIDTVSMLAPDQDRAEAFYQNLLAAANSLGLSSVSLPFN